MKKSLALVLVVFATLFYEGHAQYTLACAPNTTMSYQCNCGVASTIYTGLGNVAMVSCAYMGITQMPISIPSTLSELYLAGNQITNIYLSDLSPLPLLQVLDMRRNNLTRVPSGLFNSNSALSKLVMDMNILTTLPSGLFAKTPKLASIFLGGNVITYLPDGLFSNLTLLTTLRLENNQLTTLPSNILRGTGALTTIYLHRNFFSAVPVGLFQDQSALTQLRLDVNNFRIIPQNTFSGIASLTTLGMNGNPSFCSLVSGVIVCYCAYGYVGASQLAKGTYCQPIDCGTQITGLPPNSTGICTNNTRYLGNPCLATCNAGYIGNATYTCSQSGLWTGSLTCTPRSCGSIIPNLDPNATAVCSGRNVVDGDPCVATCNAGYIGGSTSYTCSTAGVWTGSLLCTPQDCGKRIIGLDPNAYAYCNRSSLGSTCNATCNDGFVGTPTTYTCGTDALWKGFISCASKDCGRALTTANGLHPNATARCRGDTTYGGRNCTGTCNAGFNGGSTTFVCQKSGLWAPVHPMSCSRVVCGATNITVENSTYTCPQFSFTDTCVVSCLPGYRDGNGTYTCSADASWRGNLTCPPIDCGPVAPLLDENAISSCNGSLFDRNLTVRGHCTASCRPGYELVPSAVPLTQQSGSAVTYMCNETGWAGPDGLASPYCTRIDCGEHPAQLNSSWFNVSCPQGTLFESTCYIRCGTGLLPYNVAFPSVCLSNGTWFGAYDCNIPPSTAPFIATTQAPSSSTSIGMIAGAAGGGAALLLLLIVLVVVLRARKPAVSPSPARPKSSYVEPTTATTDEFQNPMHPRNRSATNSMMQESDFN